MIKGVNMKITTSKIAFVGVLAAMSAALYYFPTFSIFPMFNWLEIDFADIPALLASAFVSPAAGVAVVLIRNTLHLVASSTMWIGELSNFLISGSFVAVFGLVARVFAKKKSLQFKWTVVSLLCGAIVQLTVACLVNYFIMIPLFSAFVDFSKIGESFYIYAGVLPFNAIKDAITSVLFLLLFGYTRKYLVKYLKF
jgi:riboflavin transporter FmnP